MPRNVKLVIQSKHQVLDNNSVLSYLLIYLFSIIRAKRRFLVFLLLPTIQPVSMIKAITWN